MFPAPRSLVIVFVVALVARALAAAMLGIDGPPEGDERGYVLLAESLASGDGLRLPVPADWLAGLGIPDHPPLRSFRAPLLPLALSPIAALGGGVVAMRVAVLVIGSLCAPALFVAGRSLLPERAAFITALVYACWPPMIHLSLRVLTEPLSMLLLLSAIALTIRPGTGEDGAMTPGSGTPASTFLGRRAVRAGVAGALAGLAVLARPAALLAALLLVPTTGSRRRSLALALGLVAAMAPWLMRNWVVVGSPVLTTNSGVTLVGANCEAALHAKVPGKWLSPDRVYSSHDLDKPDLGMWGWSELGEVESSRRFAAHALGVVRSQPGRWLTLTGWKLVRLFDPDPRSQKPDAWWKAIVGWLTVTPVLVLVLVGCWDIRRRPRAWLPFLAPLIGTLLTAAIFYGDTRMRTAADPTLLLLAAAGVLELARRARAGTQPPPQVLVK